MVLCFLKHVLQYCCCKTVYISYLSTAGANLIYHCMVSWTVTATLNIGAYRNSYSVLRVRIGLPDFRERNPGHSVFATPPLGPLIWKGVRGCHPRKIFENRYSFWCIFRHYDAIFYSLDLKVLQQFLKNRYSFWCILGILELFNMTVFICRFCSNIF